LPGNDRTAPPGAVSFEPLLFPLLLIVTALVYWPGLEGPFLLDDLGSLPILAEVGGVHDWQGLLRFLSADVSSPIGRPLANLSFLANYQSWPAPPWPFKLTNLCLHLLVGSLLYLLVRHLAGPGLLPRQAARVALITTTFWLLNPVNVSTTLYVVQRMAQLSAAFMMAGLLAYYHGRTALASDRKRGYLWMSGGIVLFTGLAILSKENGALLPLLALALEHTVLRHRLNLPPANRLWTAIFLWLPTLAMFVAMIQFAGPAAYAARNFNMAERLLSEGRILVEYIFHWFNPFSPPRGLFTDGYPVSRSLFEPWTTMPALVVVLGTLCLAIWQRHRHPLAALAILFFLAGHAVESTVVPLELYFEHRNYLPAMLLTLPIAYWLAGTWGNFRPLPWLVVTLLATMALQTWRLASVWRVESKLAYWSVRANPDSGRARDFLASAFSARLRHDLAVNVLEEAMARQPGNSHHTLHWLAEACQVRALTRSDWQRANRQFHAHALTLKSLPLLSELVESTPNAQCNGMTLEDLQSLVDGQVDHADIRKQPATLCQFLHLQGVLRIKSGSPDTALASFSQAQAIRPDPSLSLLEIAQLGSHGYYRTGLEWLSRVEKLPRPRSWREQLRDGDFDQEIRHLRTQLQSDMARQTRIRP
jgi:hypothetical protein